jgi:hypothetical protein
MSKLGNAPGGGWEMTGWACFGLTLFAFMLAGIPQSERR